MILIDTNVLSEVMKVSLSLQVLEWLNLQDTKVLYVSAITIGEIEYGLRILPNGKRLVSPGVIRQLIRYCACSSVPRFMISTYPA